MAFGFESIGSFPVKAQTFFTGTYFSLSLSFPACLIVIFQIPNANPFGILLDILVSSEITMGLGLSSAILFTISLNFGFLTCEKEIITNTSKS